MKLAAVAANNHKHAFEVTTTQGQTLTFPYALSDPAPSRSHRVIDVWVDPDLGHEAFTYTLTGGAEGSVHVDAVLEHNEDPGHLTDLMLYDATIQAKERFEHSSLSAREVARLLNTSTSQLYRLLDTTNYAKSLGQMVALLHVLGFDVELSLKDRHPVVKV